jgi:hypothetical protein
MADPLLISGFHDAFHIELYAQGLDSKNPVLKPTTTPSAWGLETSLQLASIRMVDSGHLLLRAIQKAAKGDWVQIVPAYPFQNNSSNLWDHFCNAATDVVDTTANGRRYRAQVKFSADRYQKGSYCYRSGHFDDPNSNRGTLPHEALFHELVHAFRMLSGKRVNTTPFSGGLLRYGNAEEFYAVMVTNIFISDRSNFVKSGLRRDHTASHAPLDPGLDSSLGFFRSGTEVYQLVAQFFKDHGDFARDLSCLKADFNPLFAYNSAPARAHQMSMSGYARNRDTIGRVVQTVESEEFQSKYTTPLLRLVGK